MSTTGSPARRPRVLLSAFACGPEQGSEPGVGWNRALQAARFCDTWVLCEDTRYGPRVRDYLERRGPIPGLHFAYVPRSRLQRFLWRAPGLGYLAYNLWQRAAYRLARELHGQVGFDLAHHVTFCGYREPGYLWKLGVPFVWGPVGGTQNFPPKFLPIVGLKGALREGTRSVLNEVQFRYSPSVRRAVRHAAALLAANTTVQRSFARVHGVEPLLQLETGLSRVDDHPRSVAAVGSPLRVLWSGDLQPWKALPLLLHALALLPVGLPCEVGILGQGPLEAGMRQLAEKLGVARRVRWLGWLPFAEALTQYDSADVFAFTSLRDTSGNVVLEALAAGVPVVCLDHQGARDMVTPDCGIKLPVTTPGQVVTALAEALTRLVSDPALRYRLGRAALERAREFLWDRQGERMLGVYRQVLGEGFLWEDRARAEKRC